MVNISWRISQWLENIELTVPPEKQSMICYFEKQSILLHNRISVYQTCTSCLFWTQWFHGYVLLYVDELRLAWFTGSVFAFVGSRIVLWNANVSRYYMNSINTHVVEKSFLTLLCRPVQNIFNFNTELGSFLAWIS